MITEPWFYLAASVSVLIVGIAKGGLGGGIGVVAVPLMAVFVRPAQAAAIMLPILIVMDIVSLWTWRGVFDPKTLKIMLPAGMVGIGIGWATASWVTAGEVRLLVGTVALLFAADYLRQRLFVRNAEAKPHNAVKGTFWGVIAGFTSFVSHAGGPPYQFYALPLGQEPKLYVGTSVIFFAIVNAVKLLPYFALGQFDPGNLATSAVLMPIAPVATLAGAWIVRRIDRTIFYPFMYMMIFLVGLKLVYDGMMSLAS